MTFKRSSILDECNKNEVKHLQNSRLEDSGAKINLPNPNCPFNAQNFPSVWTKSCDLSKNVTQGYSFITYCFLVAVRYLFDSFPWGRNLKVQQLLDTLTIVAMLQVVFFLQNLNEFNQYTLFNYMLDFSWGLTTFRSIFFEKLQKQLSRYLEDFC